MYESGIITGKILSFDSLDRQGEIITAACDIELDQGVVMVHDWGEGPDSVLGSANLEKRADGVWAKMIFNIRDGISMEALKLMKPCIGGTVFRKQEVGVFGLSEDVRLKSSLVLLEKIKISQIGICALNTDYSIKTLGEMINDAGA